MPNGNYKFLSDKDQEPALKTWVRQGGKIIAIENAVTQRAANDWGLKMKKEEEELFPLSEKMLGVEKLEELSQTLEKHRNDAPKVRLHTQTK